MDFSFTAEQQELRRAVRDLADDHCPTSRLREVIESPTGYDGGLWRRLAGDLGLAGIALSAASGGSDGSFVDLAIVLEEAGRALLPVPLLGTTIAAVALERSDEATAVEVLPAVATGATAAALVVGPEVVSDGDRLTGSADHVVDGGPADLLVVANESGLWLLDATATGVEVRPSATLARTRSYATVRLEGATARPVGDPAAAAAAVDLL
ncbi:MAG TPA: acyl-CoA dehydrogenase family protein, partial [Mycobacteriales bacterium]|nr:acyl-CoA dehydrogenase family protein [Mycobacteriales bacterium]